MTEKMKTLFCRSTICFLWGWTPVHCIEQIVCRCESHYSEKRQQS